MAKNANNNKMPRWFPVLMVVLLLIGLKLKNDAASTNDVPVGGSSNSNVSSNINSGVSSNNNGSGNSSGGNSTANNNGNDTGNNTGNAGGQQSSSQDKPENTVLAAVPGDLRNNVFLNRKEKGCCKTLSGNVAVTVVMVSDSVSRWDNTAVSELKSALNTHGQDVVSEASAHNVGLSFSFHYYNATLTGDVCSGDNTNGWQDSALERAGLPPLAQLHNHLIKQHASKEAPVVFVFNKPGRAYAVSGNNEYFVLFSGDDYKGFQHELSHVFGAKDYYYPEDVKAYASNRFPDSIMNSGETADSLTAYLIGWTDTVADNALQFLKDTNQLTESYISEVLKNELFTGQGTKKFETGTYTGDLVRGVCHGTGTMQYDNGGWYTGKWENGRMVGPAKGKIIYESGNIYEGDFLDGKSHGNGTMKYANGGWYTGEWKSGSWAGVGKGKILYESGSTYEGEFWDGKYHGTGILRYADGSGYEGDFSNGKRHGKGTYTYTNGAVYTGDWVEGDRRGTGTMRYSTGSWYTGGWNGDKQVGVGHGKQIYDNGVYEGELLDGKRHGQGTYVWSSGNKYSGQWANGELSGYGTYTKADGTVTTGAWKNGKYVG